MSATYPRGIFEEDLPPTLKDLCDLLGLEAVIALAQKYGGTVMMLPRTLFNGCTLPEVIGAEAAAKLIHFRGGTRLYVAKLDEALRVNRNLQIVKLYSAGEGVKKLAREFSLSERHVWRILGTPEPDRTENQLSLF